MSSAPVQRTHDEPDKTIPGAAARQATIDEELEAERSLARTILKSVAVAAPVMVVFFVALISIAVGPKDPDWGIWLGMAACVGLLAGLFFGAWAGFVRSSHILDEIDRHVRRGKQTQAAERPTETPEQSGTVLRSPQS